MPFVFDFDHTHPRPPMELKDLLGGKGANLAEMTSVLELPVPPGFTISTDACRAYMAEGWPKGLDAEVASARARLEKAMGKAIGDAKDPLLVSVRSGAKFSMPGMMDTVLNLGLNDESVEGLAAQTGDERFAFDSYRRFIAMYGRIVLELPGEEFDSLFDAAKELAGTTSDAKVPAELLRYLVDSYQQIVERHTGKPFPQDPTDQLRGAIEAVFRSWNGPRAIAYRDRERIAHDLGTAVNVQAMVFGNRDDNSGTGVGFTRDPATGDKGAYGDFLVNAQGEDVVAGIRNTEPISELKKQFPKVHAELLKIFARLESHYRDMCDTEFTIEQGKLWMLQTRVGKRTGAAALKMAVDMVRASDLGISKAEAVTRITEDHLDSVLHPQFAGSGYAVWAKGLGASPGAAVGQIYFSADDAAAAAERGEQVILVRNETSPEDVHGMLAAEGILTARGGLVSHAAVVARGWGKPAVVGAEVLRLGDRTVSAGGVTLSEGDWVSLDGGAGIVVAGQVPLTPAKPTGRLRHRAVVGRRDPQGPPGRADQRRHRRRRGQRPHARRRGHRPVPDRAHVLGRGPPARGAPHDPGPDARGGDRRPRGAATGPEGGLRGHPQPPWTACPSPCACSTRRCTSSCPRPRSWPSRRPPSGSTPRSGASTRPPSRGRRPTRCSGTRGVRLGVIKPGLYAMQVRALMEAARQRVADGGHPIVEIMIPLTVTRAELALARGWVEDAVEDVNKERAPRPSKGAKAANGKAGKLEVTIGTMIETPRAALRAGEIAEVADFFSFGTNDLTQMTFGFSRDDVEGRMMDAYLELGLLPRNPFEVVDMDGVGELVRLGTERGRATRPSLKVGVCGEHGGDPASIDLFYDAGLDYVSCSPFRVPVARLAAAQAVLARDGGRPQEGAKAAKG